MSVAAPARVRTAAAGERGPAVRVPRDPKALARPIAACLALFALYACLSLANDPRGFLGTDTGGKVATLRVMDARGGLDPDLGYWAARWDPRGTLHPLYYTGHVDGRWVNLTTLPMTYAAYPLYEIGGERAALVLPMLGAVLTALAARALARRVADRRAGWWAFWLVGLASPIALYALDFWEHSLGVAAVLGAAVLALDLIEARAGWRAAAVAGALLGLAATMRTEVLVYAVVIGVVTAVELQRRQVSLGRLVRLAVTAGSALTGVILANQVLERVTLGATLRAGRTADTAAAGGAGLGRRLEEAATTLVGVDRFSDPLDWILGALAVVAVVYGAWRIAGRDPRARMFGAVALGIATFVYVLRFADGLGFVPGLLTASPLAAAGLVFGCASRRLRRVGVLALLALPLVWAFQYSGGAAPQWGARYLLASGTLLAIAGAVVLARAPRRGALAVVALAVAVTACGVGWLSERSHAVADAMERIDGRHDQVVISQEAHVLREGGAFYTPRRHWLTAVDSHELRAAFLVARRSGATELGLIGAAGRPRPVSMDGFRRGATGSIEFLPGVRLEIVTYRR